MNATRLAAFGFLFFSSISFADFQWSDNFAWNRARVIAPGQHSWSFRTSYQSFDSRYGSTGEVQNLGKPFDRTWTWNQILSTATQDTKDSFHEYMRTHNLSENDIAASTGFDLKRQETTMEMSWAYGLAERWMIGIQVPVSLVTTELQPSTSVTAGLTGAMTAKEALQATDVRQRVQALVQSRLAAEGYGAIQPRSQNLIVGDVSLINQFALWQNPDWAMSVQQLARIPSAPNNNVADYIRYSRGDGQIDLGATALMDHQWRRFLFGGKVGFVRALPDTQKMRVPLSDDSTQIVDRNVHRDIGDLVSTSFETFYKVNRRWTVNGAYLGFFKAPDHYAGDAPQASYNQLGSDTAQELHLARAGFSYLLGNPSARNSVENKWVANVNFYQPVAGQNISEGPQGSVELQAFF